ncbi:hypothetical protein EV360DRAFT_56312, partial [Lentinula raphanica]
CAEKYQANHCGYPAPAIENQCIGWRLCKDRSPFDVGYSAIVAQAMARCLNGFFDTVSISTMVSNVSSLHVSFVECFDVRWDASAVHRF